MDLLEILQSGKTVRAVGFDDAPFERGASEPVGVAGVVCKGTRFDGMVWGEVAADGRDATETLVELLAGGKFLPQLHVLVLDGIAFGGFNVVDLEALAVRLEIPCVAVMREPPDFPAIREAVQHTDHPEERLETMRRAGPVHEADDVYFQVQGTSPKTAVRALEELTDTGHIPEPIRAAHLVATAVANGESGRRA